MKRRVLYLSSAVALGLASLSLTSCGGDADLLILNWGDYMADEVKEAFEEEYNCKVKIVTVDSSEQMYTNVKNELAEYDLVIPSDYTINQMAEEKLIKKLDYSKLSNYNNDVFVPELKKLMDSDNCKSYDGYYIPYFWGSLGIMYNTRVEGLEEAVKANGWSVLFESDKVPAGTKVGMYKTSRDSLAAAELYLGYSLNTTDTAKIDECMNLLGNTNYTVWGTDDIKTKISRGTLDVSLVYSGDFFDAYYADLEVDEANTENYSIYAPLEHNNVFFDAMVIPETCVHEDMAYKFIDFMLDHENSMTNAEYVGYCPTLKSVYDEMKASEDSMFEIEAYDPARIVNYEGSIAEVYMYLGASTYKYMEDAFTRIRS